MKRLICILASAALLGACEQKTEVVAPAAPAEKKTETSGTPASQERKREKTDTITNAPPADGAVETKSETKTETTTSSSPNP